MALPECLRIHLEPCRAVSDAEVHSALLQDPAGYLEHLEERLQSIADGSLELDLPPKRIFEDPGDSGDFRVMPCVVCGGGTRVKTVKIVGTDLVGRIVPDQVTVGKALVLHPEENFVTHVVDACALSSVRTAACAALAARRLLPGARSMTVVGAGRVGFYAGILFRHTHSLDRVVFQDIVPKRAESLAETVGDDAFTEPWRGEPAPADIVLLATTSTSPFCALPRDSEGLTISVGADTHNQRELDDSWCQLDEIGVDTADGLCVGDLLAWRQAGLRIPVLRDLSEIYRTGAKPRAFISTGSALFDNLTLGYLVSVLDPTAPMAAV
jgi:ornithine cyclodeaminase/alanine dehydrogenase-like protein (mu-crystallin family)